MSSDPKTVIIKKIGSDPPPPPSKPAEGSARKHTSGSGHRHKQPKYGVLKGGKTARSKIHAVRDPAKPPPSRKSTLKILTEKGAEKRRAHIRKTVRSLPDAKVRQMLKDAGLPVSNNTPKKIAEEILAGGMEAGMIVSR